MAVKKGIGTSGAALTVFALFLLFYPWSEEKRGGIFRLDLFLIYLCTAALGLMITYLLAVRYRSGRHWMNSATALIMIFSCGTGLFHITMIHHVYAYQSPQVIEDNIVKTGNHLRKVLPKEQNYRIGIANDGWNLAMTANLPTVNSFTSMVNGSIFDFYQSIDSPRSVKTIIPDDYYGLAPLLSERFYISMEKEEGRRLYTKYPNGSGTVYIYENPHFLPIGFTYDYYISEKQFKEIPGEDRHLVLLKAVVLSKKEIGQVGDYLLPLPESQLIALDDRSFQDDVKARAQETSAAFSRDQHGFTAKIHANSRKYAFFSVPYDQGWRATVNGQPVSIINADGMMIVPTDEGDNTIRFDYTVPGLKIGILLSVLSMAGFAGYLYIGRKWATIRSGNSLSQIYRL